MPRSVNAHRCNLLIILEYAAQAHPMPLALHGESRKTRLMKRMTMSGFTLLEMMMVIALVAVLSTGSWQGWQRWQQRQQLDDSARQVQRLLMRIRSDAWWHNAARLIWFKPGEPWCLGSGPVPEICGTPARLRLLAPWSGVSVRSLTADIGFYGQMNTARPGSIVIANGSGIRRIIVSSRGRVRICQHSGESCR